MIQSQHIRDEKKGIGPLYVAAILIPGGKLKVLGIVPDDIQSRRQTRGRWICACWLMHMRAGNAISLGVTNYARADYYRWPSLTFRQVNRPC